METKTKRENKWLSALKTWNSSRNAGSMWCMPKKGSKEYDEVKAIMEGKEAPKKQDEKEQIKILLEFLKNVIADSPNNKEMKEEKESRKILKLRLKQLEGKPITVAEVRFLKDNKKVLDEIYSNLIK